MYTNPTIATTTNAIIADIIIGIMDLPTLRSVMIPVIGAGTEG